MSNTSPHTSSLNNVDTMMIDYLTASYIIGCGNPKDDPTQRRPDISLAQKELGWEPKVQLQEGLEKTILYFKDKIKEA